MRQSGRFLLRTLLPLLMARPLPVIFEMRLRHGETFLNDSGAARAMFIERGVAVQHHGPDFSLSILAPLAYRENLVGVAHAHVDAVKAPRDPLPR
jgi:hypothetical protein